MSPLTPIWLPIQDCPVLSSVTNTVDLFMLTIFYACTHTHTHAHQLMSVPLSSHQPKDPKQQLTEGHSEFGVCHCIVSYRKLTSKMNYQYIHLFTIFLRICQILHWPCIHIFFSTSRTLLVLSYTRSEGISKEETYEFQHEFKIYSKDEDGREVKKE